LRKSVPSKPFAKTAAVPPKPQGRRISISPLTFYLGFAVLLGTNALTLVALMMSPDISKLFAGQNDSLLVAYEDRISQLRIEVDRLQSRHYAQAGDINLQLQDLAQTQELLMEQHQYVKQLADKAAELGIETASVTADAEADTGDTLLVSAASLPSGDAAAEIGAATANLNRMMDDSKVVLAALSDAATAKTDQIVESLATIGIRPKLPAPEDVGGPLLPPIDGIESTSLVDEANDVAAALERYRAARSAAGVAPVHQPIFDMTRQSSTFGNRKDPFTGRLAFHSGIDYAAPHGTKVYAAGAGTVTFVGQMSGYGNLIEITHTNGLVTRYGHLSSFIAKQGQKVQTGTPIARVGSTGRSTGPHLHFEVRRTDNAVDPSRYLKVGKQLQKILAG
jgi:murein DD-endopeptidase MepM/ murein hydrolase activator NlpD